MSCSSAGVSNWSVLSTSRASGLIHVMNVATLYSSDWLFSVETNSYESYTSFHCLHCKDTLLVTLSRCSNETLFSSTDLIAVSCAFISADVTSILLSCIYACIYTRQYIVVVYIFTVYMHECFLERCLYVYRCSATVVQWKHE